jgi:hypothetical protein
MDYHHLNNNNKIDKKNHYTIQNYDHNSLMEN